MRAWSDPSALQVSEALIDLVAPRRCAGCGEPGCLLCATCRTLLRGPAYPTEPRPAPVGFPRTWALAPYDGSVREVIVAHKEHGRLGLAAPLGDALADAVRRLLDSEGLAGARSVALVPVPSTPAATRSRGHDPVLRMSRRAAAKLRRMQGRVWCCPVLDLGRRTADQAGLGAGQRTVNLAGAHRVNGRRLRRLAHGTELVLVDDLVTTGATLAEAARALNFAGRRPLGAVVVAATVLRFDHSLGRD